MPLRRLYLVIARRGVPYKNAVDARKILEKRCSLGIYKCNIFVGKIDIATAVYRRYLGHHLGTRPLVAALAEMSLYRAAELLFHIPVKQYLTRGAKLGAVERDGHSLTFGVKELHSVYLVAEKLYSQRIRSDERLVVNIGKTRVRRIYVHNAATGSKLPGSVHQLRPDVSRVYKPCGKLGNVDHGLVILDINDRRNKFLGRDSIRERRVGRRHYNVKL